MIPPEYVKYYRTGVYPASYSRTSVKAVERLFMPRFQITWTHDTRWEAIPDAVHGFRPVQARVFTIYVKGFPVLRIWGPFSNKRYHRR